MEGQTVYGDWGEASEAFDDVKRCVSERDLSLASEAQTRFDVIDRVIREVLGWQHGQITVEESTEGERKGYADYVLRLGDDTIVIEAKKVGASFPSPTRRPKLKLSGSVLGEGEISVALAQAEKYAVEKRAGVVVATNGICWCFYSLPAKDDSSYASLLFPFTTNGHAERLFEVFSVSHVESGSLRLITNQLPPTEDRLVSALKKIVDVRVDRNTIADHIAPALNSAFHADALLSNPEHLRRCFVATEARTKFDTILGMHLADPRPNLVRPAARIRRGHEHGHVERIVQSSVPNYAPPVTLVIGPVGAGKSTYLRHFELIAGRDVLRKQRTHWVYVDFERMGRARAPREFLYGVLKDYLLADHPDNPTSYRDAVEPAYAEEIAALARGPYAPIYTNKREFNKKVQEHIERDFVQVEPYVDKVFRHMAETQLCVVILDNIDLYEDEQLETSVFAEGLALSKRIQCHVIVSVRDTTYVRHMSDSTFDAYELRKLWLDPPPFKAVLSSRLSYSRKVLKDKSAKIALANGMQLVVPDLSVFFEIVQTSILRDQAGDFIEAVADMNIRKGLTLVTNFLTSGHTNADRAIKTYLDGQRRYRFPFHEVYKGAILGQWRHFRENRVEGVNVFDSRLGSRRTRLLRLLLLNYLMVRAQREESLEVQVADCVDLGSRCGASANQTVSCLRFLQSRGLVKSVTADVIDGNTAVILTRSGGYYATMLSRRHVYVEECMFDTAIDDSEVWRALSDLTMAIESQPSPLSRWRLRRQRTHTFIDYLVTLEHEALDFAGSPTSLLCMTGIREAVLTEADEVIALMERRYA